MRFHAFHGVLPQERLVGNDYEVTVAMDCDIASAALSDDVADTINYAEAYEVVRRVLLGVCRLLELVVWNIGVALLARFDRLAAVEVSVVKRNPPMSADCEGTEERIKVTR